MYLQGLGQSWNLSLSFSIYNMKIMRAEICQCAEADIGSTELLTCAPEPAPTSQVTPSGRWKDGCRFFESWIRAGLWLLWPRVAVPILGLAFEMISHFCLRFLEPWDSVRNPTTLLHSLQEEILRTREGEGERSRCIRPSYHSITAPCLWPSDPLSHQMQITEPQSILHGVEELSG